jgi:hypothetical protein
VVTFAFETIRENTLCGIACQNIIAEVIKENNLPEGIFANQWIIKLRNDD